MGRQARRLGWGMSVAALCSACAGADAPQPLLPVALAAATATELSAPPVRAPGPGVVVLALGAEPAMSEWTLVVGQELRCENRDHVCHGLFSTSAPNTCDLGTLHPGGAATITFQHPGTVQIYCSLHAGERVTVHVVEP